jgi:ATP:ADP antiporter, AAA family
VFSLLFTLVKTNGDYMMARAVQDAANKAVAAGTLQPSHVQNYIGGVFATFTFWIDIVSLALQGLAVSRVVTYLGFGAGLYALPIVALGDAALMSAWPVLTVVRIGKTAESAIDYSLNNTMRHMLWLPTARRAKYLAKQATDTIFVRAGDIASATMIFAAGRLGLPPRAVPIGNLFLIGVWFALAAAILKERRRLLEPSARAHGETSRRGIDWASRTGLIAAIRRRGKADGKRAPLTGPALHADRSLMPIDDPLREGES